MLSLEEFPMFPVRHGLLAGAASLALVALAACDSRTVPESATSSAENAMTVIPRRTHH
jgi:hypothetical protein